MMASRVHREHLILYSLDLLLDASSKPGAHQYTKENLSSALEISPKTLDLYLTKLSGKGLIKRSRKKYASSLVDSLSITLGGTKELERLEGIASKMVLTPERHGISSVIPLKNIIDRIRDPLEKVFFFSVYISVPQFDLIDLMHTLHDIAPGSDITQIISELEPVPETGPLPVPEIFFRSSLFGNIVPEELDTLDGSSQDVNALLILAESYHKRGKLQQAKMIYDHLLSGKVKLTKNQWYIAHIGLAMTIFKDNRPIEAVGLIDEIREDVDNPVMLAYLKQVKGRILSDLNPSEEVIKLLDSAVRSFELQGIPLLCCIAYNNRGVYYYRVEDLDRAEADWKKAMRFAKEAGSYYSEGAIRCNLSDIEAKRKNFDKSADHLDKARRIFEERGDLDGISSVEYNCSLMYIEKGDIVEAFKHYKISEEVAAPLPTEIEKRERRQYFLKAARQNNLPLDSIEQILSSRDLR
jgi:tetratricopeptide (TPR) repeat protein